jgi:hypothetical protein
MNGAGRAPERRVEGGRSRRRPLAWLGALSLAWASIGAASCDRRVDLGVIGDASASMLWRATFETGDLSEWKGDGQGGEYNENITLDPTPTTAVAHGGQYAGMITLSPSFAMTSTNYLFRNQPSPPAAYYSAWFYVPSTIKVSAWLSLTHFRESQTNDGNNLSALWDVNLYPRPYGGLAAQLYDYVNHMNWVQPNPVAFPFDTWVQLEVFLAKSTGPGGRITVWQDGVLIFDRPGATVQNDWIQWDAGGASDPNLTPSPATIYIDDAAISTTRLGPGS